jgi:hypothetical protein
MKAVQEHTSLPVTSDNLCDHIMRFFDAYYEAFGPLTPYARNGEMLKDVLKRIIEEGEAESLSTGVPDLKLKLPKLCVVCRQRQLTGAVCEECKGEVSPERIAQQNR